MFESTWDHPPQFSLMHRPGICSVRGDRVVLDGTTIDEIEVHHRKTLVLVINEVNRVIAAAEAQQRRRADEQRQRREEQRKNVEEASRRMQFDE